MDKSLFIIFYNHYLLKISKLKKSDFKIKFSNLINYSGSLLPKW